MEFKAAHGLEHLTSLVDPTPERVNDARVKLGLGTYAGAVSLTWNHDVQPIGELTIPILDYVEPELRAPLETYFDLMSPSSGTGLTEHEAARCILGAERIEHYTNDPGHWMAAERAAAALEEVDLEAAAARIDIAALSEARVHDGSPYARSHAQQKLRYAADIRGPGHTPETNAWLALEFGIEQAAREAIRGHRLLQVGASIGNTNAVQLGEFGLGFTAFEMARHLGVDVHIDPSAEGPHKYEPDTENPFLLEFWDETITDFERERTEITERARQSVERAVGSNPHAISEADETATSADSWLGHVEALTR